MINAIIIDDEKDGAEVLEFLIRQYCPNINIVSIDHSVNGAILSIKNLKPDLIFLDIEMPTGTGFDVVQATKGLDYEIIFITAYEHYAIKAFKTNAIDYLLKPIDIDELVFAVKSAEKRILLSEKRQASQLESFMFNTVNKNKKISIPSQEGVFWVDLDDIIRLEAESNYTHVYIKNKKQFIVAKTLKSFEEQLNSPDFCRIHSAHLINLNEVERYIKGDGGTVILKDSTNLPVSRANKNELLKKLNLYL